MCKGYIENKNKRTLFTYVLRLIPFKYKMINTKEEFFMSYMSLTIYNIYSFLFIIVYIVCICIIIYLLILYVGIC